MAAITLKSLSIKVVKGNKLATLFTEDFTKGVFQDALKDGVDRNKAVHVKTQVAALGARGDYIELVAFVSVGTAGDVLQTDSIYVDALDFTGVPTAVQHTVFGKYSPFITPKESMQESMTDGIDRQELGLSTNTSMAQDACATETSQIVRGEADARITYYADSNDLETATEVRMKIKPNADGVFVIPAGAKIWAIPTADGFTST